MDLQPTGPVADGPTVPFPSSPPDAVAALSAEACRHRAVQHPFLELFRRGAFGPRMRHVAQAYARWYDGYSRWFPRYLQAVIERLDHRDHRALLAENLAEEQGRLCPEEHAALVALGIDPKEVDGVPHPELFARFRRAIGLSDEDVQLAPAATAAWREEFLGMLESGSAAYGVGALGLGTETVVSTIYAQLLDGLAHVDGLAREDVVFFELHCHVDDQHQEDLLAIARALAERPGGIEELRRGMRDALDARARFWDALHAHAAPRSEVRA